MNGTETAYVRCLCAEGGVLVQRQRIIVAFYNLPSKKIRGKIAVTDFEQLLQSVRFFERHFRFSCNFLP